MKSREVKIEKTMMEVTKLTDTDTLVLVSYSMYYVEITDGLFVYSTEEMMEIYGEDIFDKIKNS